jgi:hypothetical protein
MTTSRELLQQALDDLLDYRNRDTNKTIEAIRAHLAKEPKPVAWIYTSDLTGGHLYKSEVLLQGLPANRTNYTPLFRKEDV